MCTEAERASVPAYDRNLRSPRCGERESRARQGPTGVGGKVVVVRSGVAQPEDTDTLRLPPLATLASLLPSDWGRLPNQPSKKESQ